MYARKVVPILLITGAVMIAMYHKRHGVIGEGDEGEQHRRIGLPGRHGEWGMRVPPMFEKWHNLAHAQEQQAQSTAI